MRRSRVRSPSAPHPHVSWPMPLPKRVCRRLNRSCYQRLMATCRAARRDYSQCRSACGTRGITQRGSPAGRLDSARRTARTSIPVVAAAELLDLAFRFVACQAVTLLDLAGQLFTVALQLLQVVISQLAPLFLDLAFDLVPCTGYTIIVHKAHSLLVRRNESAAAMVTAAMRVCQRPTPHACVGLDLRKRNCGGAVSEPSGAECRAEADRNWHVTETIAPTIQRSVRRMRRSARALVN